MLDKAFRTLGIVALIVGAALGTSGAAPTDLGAEIEASIQGLWGDGSDAIVLFGVAANVGDVVRASLTYGDSTDQLPFRDPLPTHTFCGPGCRNDGPSVVSRIGISSGYGRDILLIVDLAGRTGFQPGSSGYIRILSPQWRIAGIVAGNASMNSSYSGFGVRVVQDRLIEWDGRGGCPACTCPENGPNFVVLLQRVE